MREGLIFCDNIESSILLSSSRLSSFNLGGILQWQFLEIQFKISKPRTACSCEQYVNGVGTGWA